MLTINFNANTVTYEVENMNAEVENSNSLNEDNVKVEEYVKTENKEEKVKVNEEERVKEEEKVDVKSEGLNTIKKENEEKDEEKETTFDKEIREAMIRYQKRHKDADGNVWYESDVSTKKANKEEYSFVVSESDNKNIEESEDYEECVNAKEHDERYFI